MRGVSSLRNTNKRLQKLISKCISEILFVVVLYRDVSIIEILIYSENEWFDSGLYVFVLSK